MRLRIITIFELQQIVRWFLNNYVQQILAILEAQYNFRFKRQQTVSEYQALTYSGTPFISPAPFLPTFLPPLSTIHRATSHLRSSAPPPPPPAPPPAIPFAPLSPCLPERFPSAIPERFPLRVPDPRAYLACQPQSFACISTGITTQIDHQKLLAAMAARAAVPTTESGTPKNEDLDGCR